MKTAFIYFDDEFCVPGKKISFYINKFFSNQMLVIIEKKLLVVVVDPKTHINCEQVIQII